MGIAARLQHRVLQQTNKKCRATNRCYQFGSKKEAARQPHTMCLCLTPVTPGTHRPESQALEPQQHGYSVIYCSYNTRNAVPVSILPIWLKEGSCTADTCYNSRLQCAYVSHLQQTLDSKSRVSSTSPATQRVDVQSGRTDAVQLALNK